MAYQFPPLAPEPLGPVESQSRPNCYNKQCSKAPTSKRGHFLSSLLAIGGVLVLSLVAGIPAMLVIVGMLVLVLGACEVAGFFARRKKGRKMAYTPPSANNVPLHPGAANQEQEFHYAAAPQPDHSQGEDPHVHGSHLVRPNLATSQRELSSPPYRVVAFVFGLLSVVPPFLYLGSIIGPLALCFWRSGRKAVKAGQAQPSGLHTAALVLGIIGTTIGSLIALLLVLTIAAHTV